MVHGIVLSIGLEPAFVSLAYSEFRGSRMK